MLLHNLTSLTYVTSPLWHNLTSDAAVQPHLSDTTSPLWHNLTSLTVDCSRRELDRMPAALPPTARRLYVEGNNIEDLGDGRLSAATNLSVLIVEDNRLTELHIDAMCRLTRLQVTAIHPLEIFNRLNLSLIHI